MPSKKRPSAAARGYDATHKQHVHRLHQQHIDGTPCFWCGLPMFRDRTKNPDFDPHATRSDGKPDTSSGTLHGEHPEGKGSGPPTRLMHGLCNKQRGDGSRDNERPALHLVESASELGELTMGWPAG